MFSAVTEESSLKVLSDTNSMFKRKDILSLSIFHTRKKETESCCSCDIRELWFAETRAGENKTNHGSVLAHHGLKK